MSAKRWNLGAIHKRSECERSNANWDRSKIDLNEREHFLKANWDRSQIVPKTDSIKQNGEEFKCAFNILAALTQVGIRSFQFLTDLKCCSDKSE